jgi:hypothetical protein
MRARQRMRMVLIKIIHFIYFGVWSVECIKNIHVRIPDTEWEVALDLKESFVSFNWHSIIYL